MPRRGVTDPFPSGFGAPAIVGAGFPGIGLPTSHSLNSSGGLGGVHAGYNWQVTNWLLGVEADWMWLNRNASNAQTTFDTFSGPRPDGSMLLSSNHHWLASVRGRLGMVAQPQWMLYVTGAPPGRAHIQLRRGHPYRALLFLPHPLARTHSMGPRRALWWALAWNGWLRHTGSSEANTCITSLTALRRHCLFLRGMVARRQGLAVGTSGVTLCYVTSRRRLACDKSGLD